MGRIGDHTIEGLGWERGEHLDGVALDDPHCCGIRASADRGGRDRQPGLGRVWVWVAAIAVGIAASGTTTVLPVGLTRANADPAAVTGLPAVASNRSRLRALAAKRHGRALGGTLVGAIERGLGLPVGVRRAVGLVFKGQQVVERGFYFGDWAGEEHVMGDGAWAGQMKLDPHGLPPRMPRRMRSASALDDAARPL